MTIGRRKLSQRLHARPRGGRGPEDVLTRKGAALTTRPRAAVGSRPGESVESQECRRDRHFPGRVLIDEECPALETAQNWTRRDTIWTDGSQLGSGGVGAACAWRSPGGWTGRHYFLGSSKEDFDAGKYAIYRALLIFDQNQESSRQYTVFVNSMTAMVGFGPMHSARTSAFPKRR